MTPARDGEPDGGREVAAVEGDAEPERVDPPAELLVLRLGESRFGLWVDELLEIVETPPISRLPLPSREVPGVTSIRGEIVPVLDLGMRLLDAPAARPGRLVLVGHEASGSMVGLLVDAVETLVPVRRDELLEPPESAGARVPRDMVSGVVATADAVITVLNLGRAAAPPGGPSREEG